MGSGRTRSCIASLSLSLSLCLSACERRYARQCLSAPTTSSRGVVCDLPPPPPPPAARELASSRQSRDNRAGKCTAGPLAALPATPPGRAQRGATNNNRERRERFSIRCDCRGRMSGRVSLIANSSERRVRGTRIDARAAGRLTLKCLHPLAGERVLFASALCERASARSRDKYSLCVTGATNVARRSPATKRASGCAIRSRYEAAMITMTLGDPPSEPRGTL